jgi:predicted permease
LHVRLYADLLSTCVCVCVCVSTVCGLGLVLLAVLLGAPLVSLLQVAPPLVSLLQVGLLVLQRGKCS